MKKLTFIIFVLCSVICAHAQQTISERKQSLGPKNYPWKTTTGAEELMNSYRRLIDSTFVGSCNPKTYSVTGYMPANDYQDQKDSGYITFSSWVCTLTPGYTDIFRTIFDYYAPFYPFYGVCTPDPIIWAGGSQNDVYEAFLIPVEDYKNASYRSYNALRSNPHIVYASQTAKLITWGYESNKGFCATHTPDAYNSSYSSNGLRVKVLLKCGTEEWCYLVNNYDGSRTIVWKDATGLPDESVEEEKTVTPVATVKLSSASLQQNQPNPVSGNTIIAYSIPEKFSKAAVRITDFNGRVIRIISITSPGSGSIGVDASGLVKGTYKYALYIDDALIESKTMLVEK